MGGKWTYVRSSQTFANLDWSKSNLSKSFVPGANILFYEWKLPCQLRSTVGFDTKLPGICQEQKQVSPFSKECSCQKTWYRRMKEKKGRVVANSLNQIKIIIPQWKAANRGVRNPTFILCICLLIYTCLSMYLTKMICWSYSVLNILYHTAVIRKTSAFCRSFRRHWIVIFLPNASPHFINIPVILWEHFLRKRCLQFTMLYHWYLH